MDTKRNWKRYIKYEIWSNDERINFIEENSKIKPIKNMTNIDEAKAIAITFKDLQNISIKEISIYERIFALEDL